MNTNAVSPNPPAGNQPPPADSPAAALGCDLPLPRPAAEHEWLRRFVGEWDSVIEMLDDAGEPATTMRGTEEARMVGGFWMVSEGRNLEFPYAFRLTLGYDPERAKYIGTWIDSMTSFLWHYEGTVDSSDRILTLETQGPFPPIPGTLSRYREVTEFVTDEHRVFTSARLDESGRWTTHLRIHFHRKAETGSA